ncbi:MAG: rRNA methylase [Rickettsiaceae bacterium]|jgi:23S rRNA (guanosine2251-2'-O)-methyltransferase|nr:rRNA methylase [Rickettsiaceae bacterium]
MKRKTKNTYNSGNSSIFLYGKHACIAALGNPNRKILRLLATKNSIADIPAKLRPKNIEIVENKDFDKLIPNSRDVVHQGIVLEVAPLADTSLNAIINERLLVILDQVTDPHNVGAILRSCAAFGAGGVIFPKDNAPAESGTLAKTASGALEIVPICRVTNLARTIEQLKKDGFWVMGLDGHTKTNIGDADLSGKIALVMGAEGKGLRQLTRENCDFLVRLPISEAVESLNVSNAAAVALYECVRGK